MFVVGLTGVIANLCPSFLVQEEDELILMGSQGQLVSAHQFLTQLQIGPAPVTGELAQMSAADDACTCQPETIVPDSSSDRR